MTDEWEPRLVRVPKGSHRSVSRDTPGADRELLREDGTNRLLGPPESIPFDPYSFRAPDEGPPPGPDQEWELSPQTQELVNLVGTLLGEAAWAYSVKTAKHVGPIVKQNASALGNRLRRGSRAAKRQPGSTDAVSQDADSFKEVEAAPGGTEVDMSLDEFREGCRRLLLAEQYLAQLKDLLSRARISDDDLSAELGGAINEVLAGNTVALDEQSIAILMSFLARGESADEVDALPAPRRVVDRLHVLRGGRRTG